ncbi:hypothetical protein [Micromonospora gifhornensis]|uniref:hypothetical protein n=1 Tax=Micromonospora gifhornensis TaxID=84594 RepID=UPI003D73EAE8
MTNTPVSVVSAICRCAWVMGPAARAAFAAPKVSGGCCLSSPLRFAAPPAAVAAFLADAVGWRWAFWLLGSPPDARDAGHASFRSAIGAGLST